MSSLEMRHNPFNHEDDLLCYPDPSIDHKKHMLASTRKLSPCETFH